MTMILSFCLLFAKVSAVWGAAPGPSIGALKLAPFGELIEIMRTRNPWHGFEPGKGSVVLITRAERIDGMTFEQCGAWSKAVSGYLDERRYSREKLVEQWGPWKDQDLKGAQSCVQFPCAYKLNAEEVSQMGRVSPSMRRNRLLAIVEARVEQYEKMGSRGEYEFSGKPVEPWSYFENLGFNTAAPRPVASDPRVRILDFAPEKLRAVRQVFDRRVASGSVPNESTWSQVWIRDIYNAHYFESWGEWMRMDCRGGANGTMTLLHALMIELDGLKETDFVSRISYNRMRQAARDQGDRYLSEAFSRLQGAAQPSK